MRDSLDRVVYDLYGPPLRTDSWAATAYPRVPLGAHEAAPAGWPSAYRQAGGVMPGVAPPFPATGYKSANHDGTEVLTHHNVWGVCVPGAPVQPVRARRVRLHLDVPRVHHLIKGVWRPVCTTREQAGRLDGGYFSTSPFTKTLDIDGGSEPYWRPEAIGWSISLYPTLRSDGSPDHDRETLHWFFTGFSPRKLIPPGAQVSIRTRVRLISDSLTTSQMSGVQFLAHFSGDLFTGPNVSVHPSGVNPPFSSPRFVKIGTSWTPMGHVTAPFNAVGPATLRSYPPIPMGT